MVALPQNNTDRVHFDYVTGVQTTSKRHTVTFRGVGPVFDTGDVQDFFVDFLTALGPSVLRVGWKVEGVRLSPVGQNFSLPLPIVPALQAFAGTSATVLNELQETQEWTWQGRSFTSGRRVDFSLYGLVTVPPTNLRYTAGGGGSPAWVAATVNILNNHATYPWGPATVDGTMPTWQQYVNMNYNSYWEGEIRR